MGKSEIGNLSKAVHLKQTRRMVIPIPYDRIHSQLCHPCCHTTNPVFVNDGLWTPCLPPLGKTFLPNLEKWLADLSTTQDDIQAAHKMAQQKMREQITTKFSHGKSETRSGWKQPIFIWTDQRSSRWNKPVHLKSKKSYPAWLSASTFPPDGRSILSSMCYGTRSQTHLLCCTFTTFNYWFSFHVHRPRRFLHWHFPIRCMVVDFPFSYFLSWTLIS